MKEILTEQDGPILRITLNRPEAGNAVTDEMATELTRLVEGAADKAEFVLLRAAGADFCVGRASMGQAPKTEPEALERRRQSEVIFNCYGALRRSAVPVVGVVQGRARGFGCALAGACDITISSDAATYQIPEIEHNIMPTMVMSSLIDRVTMKALGYLVWSAAVIDARRALGIGLVSEVVPAGELDQAVRNLCAALASRPRPAIRAVKEYLRTATSMDIHGAVDYARNLHATINSSSEMRKRK